MSASFVLMRALASEDDVRVLFDDLFGHFVPTLRLTVGAVDIVCDRAHVERASVTWIAAFRLDSELSKLVST